MKSFVPALALACALASSPSFAAQPVPEPPIFKARSYALMDYESGQLIAAQNADQHVEPASLTKLMTVYIAFDQLRSGQIKRDGEVTISEKAWRAEGSTSFMEVGKRIPVDALLHGIIVQSGNDASIALAEHMAGTEAVFADLMNRYAKKIGMTDSSYTNATGLPDDKLYTSAHDVARLSRALIHDFPDEYPLFSLKEYVFNNIRQPNRNRLLWRDPTVDGLKTGHTKSAGYSLVASAVRDGRRLIAAVVGTDSEEARASACLALLNYGFRFYETVTALPAKTPATTIRAWKGDRAELALGVQESLAVAIPRGRAGKLSVETRLDGPVFAPVKAGQAVGSVTVSLEGEVLRQVPLTALADLPEGGLLRRLWDEVQLLVAGTP